ncbi:MAG: hypothetical protein ACD_48C00502G0002 [uncultured bacterium]|nr:MAG: hypothetical protein ACD_48C00502G0002 [uncultured bacterium]
MARDLSQALKFSFKDLSDEEFFSLAKKELQRITKETERLEKDVKKFIDKAKEKQLLTDILHKY